MAERSRILKNRTDAYEYARNKLFMYAGESRTVSFRCKEKILDQMIDLFGPEAKIYPDSEGSFLISVKTTDTGAIFLAQQFMDSIELLEPLELREQFRKILKDTNRKYK